MWLPPHGRGGTVVSLKKTDLFRHMVRVAPDVPAGPPNLPNEFEKLQRLLEDAGKYIVLSFPEHTPHDHARHLDHVFALADRILGVSVYTRLAPTEVILLAFGLYAHDWGMAVSDAERESLLNTAPGHGFAFLPDEPSGALDFMSEARRLGVSDEIAWRNYVRHTHGLRSGARLRGYFEPLGAVFADAVARIAEGHSLDLREVRDPERYPRGCSVFGETVNLAALATYVRIVDLLDIGDDRTPYALWKFVAPLNPLSSLEWQKHRALSPISLTTGPTTREILITGRTDDPAVFAALADLRSWVDSQFAESIGLLRTMPVKYHLPLDSRLNWSVDAVGFKPLLVKFDFDRTEVLDLLSSELYRHDPLAFLRELLQNSVDAIDIRATLLREHGSELKGEIRVKIRSHETDLCIEWSDNGIGMDETILSSYFATLGRSWYKSREATRLAKIDAISQFGIGVLSCFTVSRNLTVVTRKDAAAGDSGSGLVVEIPTQASHFRIRAAANIPVGTTVRLDICPHLTTVVSKEAICVGLAQISRYVRHKITVDSDGVLLDLGATAASRDELNIALHPVRGDSAEVLHAISSCVNFEFGGPAGDFHGHYSAMIPKRPSEVIHGVDYSLWFVGDKRIELDDIIVNTEQALFTKGIQVGPVTKSGRGMAEGNILGARYTGWISPRVVVNIRCPSYLQFSLDRSSAHFRSEKWIEAIWQDIARKLRQRAFDVPVETPGDAAMVLGACAVFGGVPEVGLDALIQKDETPLLVLRSKGGMVWISLKDFTHGDEFGEAPYELAYANHGEFPEIGNVSVFPGWEGDDVLFPSEGCSSYNYPWLSDVLSFGCRALAQLGWQPVALRLLNAPRDERVPLVCRVWEKVGLGRGAIRPGELRSETGPWEANEWAVLRSLYREAPEVLRFPVAVERYAAIGSRYWNCGHPKIGRIISALTGLKNRQRAQMLSPDRSRAVSYLTSNTFYGYVVPSRMADVTLAIEVPNRLLDIAEEEGLACSDRLVPSDFLPGTVEGYSNPYHYSLRGWEHRGTNLGRPL